MRRIAHLALLLSFVFPGIAFSQTYQEVDDINQHGVYVKGKNGYEPAQVISQLYNLNYDFSSRVLQLPVVVRADQALELIIHQPDMRADFFTVEARSMGSLAARSQVTSRIETISDDVYRLTFDEVPDDRVVLVDLGCCHRAIHAVALSAPKPTLLRIYGKGQDHNPVSAEHALSRIVSGAEDDELSALHQHWQLRVAQKKASENYAFIQTVWERYEAGETPDERFKALRHVRKLCENYLAEHEQGIERTEVQRLLETADNKLNI